LTEFLSNLSWANHLRIIQWDHFEFKIILKNIVQAYLFLDTGGTEGIANNPKIVTNIKQSNHPIELETTGGTKIEDKEATIPGYKSCIWYDKEEPISTLSFGKLVQEPNIDKITYDSSKEDAFNIHTMDAGTIKFKHTPNGLYAFLSPQLTALKPRTTIACQPKPLTRLPAKPTKEQMTVTSRRTIPIGVIKQPS
jgi:hypothetical protein